MRNEVMKDQPPVILEGLCRVGRPHESGTERESWAGGDELGRPAVPRVSSPVAGDVDEKGAGPGLP
jgi:hypothetical protein